MITSRNLRRSKLTVGISLALAVTSGAVKAQDSGEVADTSADMEEVIVSGFRKSLLDSINTKRENSSIVEVISAEDIGKLPDSSIAESIARLPGLAAQRLDGRASRVSIRGFGENESATTFNGREQVSISDNRGVEFDLYPSEIMSGVVVYKTPDASLEAEGIAGVIDLRTVKPLDQERGLQINGQFEQTSLSKLNPDGDDQGYRGTFSYVDQFADDTVGVAFAYSTMSSPNQENRWNAWGYPEFTVDGQNFSVLGGAKPFVRSSLLDRDSAMLVIDVQPSDKLRLIADALYVDFSDQKILRGIEVPFAWGQGSISADTAVVDPDTGFVSSAITQGQRVVVRNDFEERNADLTSFGFNAEFDASDRLTLEFDASYSEVNRDVWSMENYAGTGRGNNQGVADDIGYTLRPGGAGAVFTPGLDYSDYDLIRAGGPLTWGWQSSLNEKFGIVGTDLENTAQDGFINSPGIDDELTALKFAAKQIVDSNLISEVKYGISYREREKTKDSKGFFLTLNAFPEMLQIPEQYRLGTVSLDFIGMGDMIAYNSVAMINDGLYDLTEETGKAHSTKSWTVKEEVIAAFVQANIETEVAGFPLTGNLGLRYVQTDQSSQGSAFLNNELIATDISHDYDHFLPSLNLNLALTDTQSLRLGIAQTLSRPRMDEMNASVELEIGSVGDANGNLVKAKGGNAELEPKEALGVDLTYENYFSNEGYFSVALFWKDLNEWIFDGVEEVPSSNFIDNAPSENATVEFKTNGGGGTLRGAEISFSLPFNVFSERLDGFGLLASHTRVSSDVKDHNGNDFQLPGLSETIQNATFYYEKNGLQVRASVRKRDDFKGEVFGLGFNTEQVDILGETLVDAQIGFDFGEAGFTSLEGLSVFLQGINLTDEPFTSTQGSDLKIRDFQEYGKTYLLGFSYKFM